MLPPRFIRRLVLGPLAIVIAVAFVVLFPLLAALAMVFGLLARAQGSRAWPAVDGPAGAGPAGAGRGMRGLRVLCFALVWFAAETAALFMCFGLWIASGFGGRLRTEPYQARHYEVMQWFLDKVFRAAARTLRVRVEIDEPELTAQEAAARLARPVIVLSRHAGPGDSLLLVHHLLSVYGRRPRIVMKASMQLDPGVDVVGNRLPNVFISRRKAGGHLFVEQIKRLARGLDETGALVIFPEGGNWTPGRRQRAIQRLSAQGEDELANRARGMRNLLPPRAGGALAAIATCPSADVIFVAHAGLDRLVSIADIWRGLPMDQDIRARWWRVSADDVPRAADHDDQVAWLYDWWERIDSWITQNRPLPSWRPTQTGDG